MPLKLDRTERTFLVALGSLIVVVIALVFLLVPNNQDDPGYPSSTSTHSNGSLAAYLTLQECGYDIQRWYHSPADLPSEAAGTTLILAEPFPIADQGEKTEIARYISNGGRVLIIGQMAGRWVPRSGVQALTVARTEWKATNPSVPSALTRGGAFTADQASKWDSKSPDEVVQFASDDGPAVVYYRFGKGEVIWWASAVPLLNGGVQKPGNLELLLNSVGEPGRRVYWDEYFHTTHHSLYATVADTPLKFLGWQFLLFAIAVVATYSRRSGPLRPLMERSRLSPLEFIETLGGLYRQYHSPGLAVEVAYDRFRLLLMRRTGLRVDAPPELVARVVREKLRFSDGQFLNDLNRFQGARYDHNLTETDALRMVQRIVKYQSEVLGMGSAGGEN